jgi:hypothetical protein
MSRQLRIAFICFRFQSSRNISGYPKITWTNWNIFNLFLYLLLNLTWVTEGGDYEMAVFCVVAPCRLVWVYQGLKGLYCLHLQGDAWSSCSTGCLRLALRGAKFSFLSVSNPRCISTPAFYYAPAFYWPPLAHFWLSFPRFAELCFLILPPYICTFLPRASSHVLLMMEEVQTPETLVKSYQSTLRYIPEDTHIYMYIYIYIYIYMCVCVCVCRYKLIYIYKFMSAVDQHLEAKW